MEQSRADLSIGEVADLLGVTERTVQNYIKVGKLEPVYYKEPGTAGRARRRVDRMSVAKFVKNHRNS